MTGEFTRADGDRMCLMVLALLRGIRADLKDERSAPVDWAPWPERTPVRDRMQRPPRCANTPRSLTDTDLTRGRHAS